MLGGQLGQAAATVVLPTPPLPVTKTSLAGGGRRAARHRRPASVTCRPRTGSGGAESDPALRGGRPDLDVGDLDHRHTHLAALPVGQPEDAVAGLEQLLDVGTTLSRSASSAISTSSSLGVWVMPIRTSTWCHSSRGRFRAWPAGTWTLQACGRLHDMSGRPTGPWETERSVRWAATMAGYSGPVPAGPRRLPRPGRSDRRRPPATERARARRAAGGRARTRGARGRRCSRPAPPAPRAPGERARPEEPDEWRTCFERDRDRILHATVVPPPGRQDPGLRLPPGPSAHPADPCARGGPGGHAPSPGPAG